MAVPYPNPPPVDKGDEPPHDSDMEARVARLEEDMKEVKGILGRLEPMIIRIDERSRTAVTQADLAAVRAEILAANKADITDLKGELAVVKMDMKGELTVSQMDLKGELAVIHAKLSERPTTFTIITWFFGISLGLITAVLSIARYFAH